MRTESFEIPTLTSPSPRRTKEEPLRLPLEEYVVFPVPKKAEEAVV